MRLLDADRLMDDVRQFCNKNEVEWTTNKVLTWIDHAPTAYDLDKVMGALEKLKNTKEEGADEFCPDKDKTCRYMFNDSISCTDCVIDYVINIVKKGGVE